MPADRYSLAYHHNNMVPSPAGKAAVQVIWEIEDGISLCYGTTVPTDATAGYVEGCKFLKTDAATGLIAWYTNVGTAASCNFDLVASGQQQSAIADVAITTDLTGVDTGTDMTATQAGQIETDLAALAAKINAVIAALESAGVLAS